MALSIDSSQLVDLGSLGITGYPFTLVGWFRVPNVNVLLTLMGIGNSSTGSYHRLVYSGHSTKTAGASSSITSSATAPSSIAMSTGVWHHVAGVFEAANMRRVYLDGGNSGTSAQNRVFDAADLYYMGSQSADAVDVAEAAVFKATLTADQVARLAVGLSPLCLPHFANLAAYQSCIRRLNGPGRGPTATAAGITPADHPRVVYRRNMPAQLMPLRRWAPFYLAGSTAASAGVQVGQPFTAGFDGDGGQVSIAGTVAGAAGEVQG